jgi:CubicO group peptidase (beta-lactamase class C family)
MSFWSLTLAIAVLSVAPFTEGPLSINRAAAWQEQSADDQQDGKQPDADQQDAEDPTVDDSAIDIGQLESYIDRTMKQWKVPGLAVAVVKGDQVLLCKGFGVREVGTNKAVDQHTLFAIASNTKAFTSAGLAILVDQGKLDWDDHVDKYIPWFKMSDSLATVDLRVRDLLCHRSGLGTFSGDLLWWGTDYSTREVLERTARLELAAPFRSRYGYSNLMFLAAGKVIEAASGQAYEDFIEEQILIPLRMDRTLLSVRDLISEGNFATPHKTLTDASRPIAWMNWDNMAAAGGIISSVDDMSKWLRVQLAEGAMDGKKTLFSSKQSREMWQAQTVIPISESYSTQYPSTHFRAYGLGWSLADYQGRKTVGHGGGYDGMYSQVMMIPEEDLGIVVLTNSMTGIATPIVYHVVDKFLDAPTRDWSSENLKAFKKSREAFEKRVRKATTSVLADQDPNDLTGRTPSHHLKDYAGKYQSKLYGGAVVEVIDDSLVLRLLPNESLVADLHHLHYDTFLVDWKNEFAWFDQGTANFVTDAMGVVQRIELSIPNDDLFFEEIDLRRVGP